MHPLLETLESPADLRRLSRADLPRVAHELRSYLLESVARTGGHLSSNLGTVELTIALHYVFNTPKDRLVWDVGHQTYPHKILTGRRGRMHTLRQLGGSRASRVVTRASTTLLELHIRRLRYQRLWVWPWRQGRKGRTGARWPSSGTEP